MKNRIHLSQLYQSITGKTTHISGEYSPGETGYQVPRCDVIQTFEEE